MKINFNATIKNLDGVDIQKSEADKSPVTLGWLCVNALLTEVPGKTMAPDQKFKRYELATVIKKGVHEVTSEQIVLLKEAVGEVWPPLYVGVAWNLLEGKKV